MIEILPLKPAHIAFVYDVVRENREALHMGKLSRDECRDLLEAEGSDEAHFIGLTDGVPAAWLKINGLDGQDMAWISMLVVRERFQRQGIGSFMVRFAEGYARQRGFTRMGIHTICDNAAARECYRKLGYQIDCTEDYMAGDGVRRRRDTFSRQLPQHK